MIRHRGTIQMKSAIIAIGGAVALGGCAAIGTSGPYVGRPIADAVRDLGPPHQVTDYQQGGRYFSWGTSDFIVMDRGADNPANWQTLGKRLDPVGGPKFAPSSCSLTL